MLNCILQGVSIWGARKLTGENLKVVWAEFSTLSQAILFCMPLHSIYRSMPQLRVVNSAQVSSCQLKFVHGLYLSQHYVTHAACCNRLQCLTPLNTPTYSCLFGIQQNNILKRFMAPMYNIAFINVSVLSEHNLTFVYTPLLV